MIGTFRRNMMSGTFRQTIIVWTIFSGTIMVGTIISGTFRQTIFSGTILLGCIRHIIYKYIMQRPLPVRNKSRHIIKKSVSLNLSLNNGLTNSPVNLSKSKSKSKSHKIIRKRVEQRKQENQSKNKIDMEPMSLKERKMTSQMNKTEKQMLADGVINFFSSKKEYRSLSNFWENDVTVDGRTYESGEHCFHGEKYIRLSEECKDDRQKQLLDYGQTFMKPSAYKTGAMVKKMGGKKGLLLNPNELKLWATISVEVQEKICKWKIDHYEEVREDLLKSGDKLLVHPAMRCSEEKLGERIWEGKGVVRDGQIVVLGKNMLGNIWMKCREEMK
jgi:predicted NAD-dependent protein-ADP-ribosyltransferase YbiA (DUF1768 family)